MLWSSLLGAAQPECGVSAEEAKAGPVKQMIYFTSESSAGFSMRRNRRGPSVRMEEGAAAHSCAHTAIAFS